MHSLFIFRTFYTAYCGKEMLRELFIPFTKCKKEIKLMQKVSVISAMNAVLKW